MTQVQLNLDAIIRELPRRVRLLELRWIERTFDLTEDEARELVDTGLLRFAFDVAGKGARRSEVRVFRDSAESYARFGNLARDFDPPALDEIIRQCLPPGSGPFLLSALQRPWAVKGTHLHNLCNAGELQVVPCQTLKPKQSPLIVRASAAAFLKRRRL